MRTAANRLPYPFAFGGECAKHPLHRQVVPKQDGERGLTGKQIDEKECQEGRKFASGTKYEGRYGMLPEK